MKPGNPVIRELIRASDWQRGDVGVRHAPEPVSIRTMPRRIASLGLAAFVALIIVQHATRADDLPPADHFISEYARGPGGWVQAVAFLAWGVSFAATFVLLPRGERRVARAVVGLGLVAGVIGALMCAAFATETVGGVLPEGATKSQAGQLHDLGSAGIFFGLFVAALASVRIVPRRGYRLSVLVLGLLLIAIPAALIAAGYDAPGWGQRGFIAVGCLWQWRLIQTSRDN
jgi:hypothetical protein